MARSRSHGVCRLWLCGCSVNICRRRVLRLQWGLPGTAGYELSWAGSAMFISVLLDPVNGVSCSYSDDRSGRKWRMNFPWMAAMMFCRSC